MPVGSAVSNMRSNRNGRVTFTKGKGNGHVRDSAVQADVRQAGLGHVFHRRGADPDQDQRRGHADQQPGARPRAVQEDLLRADDRGPGQGIRDRAGDELRPERRRSRQFPRQHLPPEEHGGDGDPLRQARRAGYRVPGAAADPQGNHHGEAGADPGGGRDRLRQVRRWPR